MEDVGLNTSFWRNKKVLLTGHTGFKGSWLALWLQTLASDVHGIALTPPTSPNLFTSASIASNMRHIVADIRDESQLATLIADIKPDIVFHLAAVSLVRQSYHNPVLTYQTNVIGTVNVLEAIRKIGHTKAIVCITSDKCYAQKSSACRETDPLGGKDPYSSSKACAELVAHSYYQTYFANEGIGLASARAGNVIGGGDWAAHRLIPDIIRARFHNIPLQIRNPNAVRPWQHVLEPLFGYLLLAEKLALNPSAISSAWNFGPETESAKPVRYLLDYFVVPWEPLENDVAEAQFLNLNSDKAKGHLGWQPRWNLDKALQKTADWYEHFYQSAYSQELCLQHIKDYL